MKCASRSDPAAEGRARCQRCLDRCAANSRRYGRGHRGHRAETNRASKLKGQYGLTLDDYEMLLVRQRGACKLCGSFDPGPPTRRFHVDHDHSTGRVRGLLCGNCNVALGHLRDNPELMRRAATYVERYA